MYVYELEKQEGKLNYDEFCFPFSVSMPEQIIFDIYQKCMYILVIVEEEFQEYKRVIRISKSKKSRHHNGQKKKIPHTTIHKTLHRKLKIEQCEPH
jgi:hypothetical protein